MLLTKDVVNAIFVNISPRSGILGEGILREERNRRKFCALLGIVLAIERFFGA